MKSALAVVTAIVMPGGFIVLGLALMTMFLARRRTAREGLAWGGNS